MDYKMIRNARRNLRAYRLTNHLSVRAFGERINLSGTWVSAFERGHYGEPKMERLKAIAKAMGTNLKGLVMEPPEIITRMTEEERRMGVRNLIKIWRLKKMSQAAFSWKLGMSSSFFSEVKRGTRLPTEASFNTIAKHLKMPVETLIGRE
ncbi:MAG: helix-turn-helix domain-containing protein [Acidaminococcus sp.]|uniref:helix-turn-helix domain-containing protein n=1 Tax=Acidaminococcus sp. TaxID=1872103 RepID=UPI003F14FBA3